MYLAEWDWYPTGGCESVSKHAQNFFKRTHVDGVRTCRTACCYEQTCVMPQGVAAQVYALPHCCRWNIESILLPMFQTSHCERATILQGCRDKLCLRTQVLKQEFHDSPPSRTDCIDN